jgi:chemotaxis protein MotB
LVRQFPTNWELSTARATNVVRFLQEKTGIEAARLQAVGLSEFHPVASNNAEKGRSQNRRIEIALLPEEDVAQATVGKE